MKSKNKQNDIQEYISHVQKLVNPLRTCKNIYNPFLDDIKFNKSELNISPKDIDKLLNQKYTKIQISEFLSKIRPVIRDLKGILRYLHISYFIGSNPVNSSFMREPRFGEIVTNIEAYKVITMYVPEYYDSANPSLSQVYSQIPADDLDKICAFEIIEHDLNRNHIFNLCYKIPSTRCRAIKTMLLSKKSEN